jgi:hypothetical protein
MRMPTQTRRPAATPLTPLVVTGQENISFDHDFGRRYPLAQRNPRHVSGYDRGPDRRHCDGGEARLNSAGDATARPRAAAAATVTVC